MDNLRCGRQCDFINRPAYIVLFKGDDSDFQGNQSVDIVIDTELDTTGMKAHFRFMDFVQDFNSIPENKTLSLVFPNAKTSEFPLGAADATLRFEDASGKFRTVSNRIHIVVTNSVHEAYDNEDSQSITVTVKGTVTWDMIEGKPPIPAPVTIDPALSPTSENPVQNKVVTKALYTGFTEWKITPSEFYGNPLIMMQSEDAPYGWMPATEEGGGVATGFKGDATSTSLSWTAEETEWVAITATRHLITPTKTSQLTNDGTNGIPFATTNQIPDTTINPIYSESPTFSGWVFSDGSSHDVSGPYEEHGEYFYEFPDGGGYVVSNTFTTERDALFATKLEFYGNQLSATRTRTDIIGYTLGTQTDKPLQPQGDYVTESGMATALAQKASLADLPYALVTLGEWEFSDGLSHNIGGPTFDGAGNFYYYLIDTTPQAFSQYFITQADAISALSLTFNTEPAITATRASLPGHLLDRAGNRVVVSGDTTLTLPALEHAGRLRDFLVRLEISGSTVPTITFAAPTGETITYETDGDTFPVPDEAGDWLYSFTESCVAHKFAVSLKKANVVTQGGV